ncbi:MAG: TatD family hydrolase [Planctomycetaceae bacterium]|jgi:TatD DNase family protein|nr:TatD family hydrolase [Planctomycetaceae bacterium]
MSTPLLIDTHCHLDESSFDHDVANVIESATTAGIVSMLTIGTTRESSERAVALAEQYESVFAAVGIQPNYVAEAKAGDWEHIVELAAHPRVLAVGETGLDKYWDHAPLELQVDYFDRHLELSNTIGKPFIVHNREADAEVVEQLRRHGKQGSLRGVMHSFCADQETADACLELDMYMSFAGMATFKRNEELRKIAGNIPVDRILVETDSPYLSPHPMRGKRNEPARVALTAQVIADVREVSIEEFSEQTTANARRLFGFPD